MSRTYTSPLVAKNSDILQKMQVMGIQCERYDSFLAGILLGNQDR
jgi:hypothetical protein